MNYPVACRAEKILQIKKDHSPKGYDVSPVKSEIINSIRKRNESVSYGDEI
jgi:hypothetical protein